MTVRELIDQLSKLDLDTPVYVRGYEGGINDIGSVAKVRVLRDHYKGHDFYGDHDYLYSWQNEKDRIEEEEWYNKKTPEFTDGILLGKSRPS